MAEPRFPLEILEKFASNLDDNYPAQARMCLVSKPLYIFTRPHLYRSFNSALADPAPKRGGTHIRYLKTIIEYRYLGQLVHDYTLIVTRQNSPWPRDVPIALLAMPNLKELTVIRHDRTEQMHDIDFFTYLDRMPFQLTYLRMHWAGPDKGRIMESIMLAAFLKKQKSIETLHMSYHSAVINELDLPNLRKAIIGYDNWGSVLPGRPITSLTMEGDLKSAYQFFKPIVPGSPIEKTLRNLKFLRIDSLVMMGFELHNHLSSLEVLVSTGFEDSYRQIMTALPKLKVVCLLNCRSSASARKDAAKWFFATISTITDVVYSDPVALGGVRLGYCERYRDGSPTPEIMPGVNSYLELIHVD